MLDFNFKHLKEDIIPQEMCDFKWGKRLNFPLLLTPSQHKVKDEEKREGEFKHKNWLKCRKIDCESVKSNRYIVLVNCLINHNPMMTWHWRRRKRTQEHTYMLNGSVGRSFSCSYLTTLTTQYNIYSNLVHRILHSFLCVLYIYTLKLSDWYQSKWIWFHEIWELKWYKLSYIYIYQVDAVPYCYTHPYLIQICTYDSWSISCRQV